MRRAIVHIGMPRTGTTTLQRVLTSLRPELGRAGVLYPELTPRSAAEPHLSHQHLGEALDGRRPSRERQELLTQLAGQLAATAAETVLLSYEGLCLIPPGLGVPRMLASLFARHGFAMEVLATVKPQGEFTNSTYTWRTQFLREHRTFQAYFQAEGGSPVLDYHRLFAPWRAACDGSMTVTPLRDMRSGQPLIARVMADLGLHEVVGPMFSLTDLALVENRSPGPVAVEVARRLRMGGAHLRLRHPRREVTRFVERSASLGGLDAIPFRALDPASRARDAARWRPSNDRFAQGVWCGPWASRVADAPAAPVNEIAQSAPDPALLAQVDRILGETCEAFQIRLGHTPGVALRTMAGEVSARLYRQFRHARARAWPSRD